MVAPLQHLLEDVFDNVADAHDGLSESGFCPSSLNELATPSRDRVKEHVETALARIESALERLDDLGSPVSVTAPEDLQAIARQAMDIANSVLDESQHPNGSPAAMCEKLRTIRFLLAEAPGGYFSNAG